MNGPATLEWITWGKKYIVGDGVWSMEYWRELHISTEE